VGERPIPSFRHTFYGADEEIFNIANQSYIKINSPKQKKNIGGEEVETFLYETTKLGKSPSNSWTKPSSIQWFKIKKYFDDDFDEFIKIINQELGYDVLSEPFENLLNSHLKHGSKLDGTINFLKENKKTPIINFFKKKDVDRSEITKNSKLGECVVSGIDVAYFLDGEILIPYEKNFVDRLVKNTTNILDGGFVEIVGLFYEDEINGIEDFMSVSDIPDEKY